MSSKPREDHAAHAEYRKIRVERPLMNLTSLEKLVIDPKDYLIGTLGWIKRGQFGIMTGRTGQGKTVLAEQMAMDAAQGLPILGQIPVSGPMKVLYTECENGYDVMKRDICSIAKNTKVNRALINKNFILDYNWEFVGDELVPYMAHVFEETHPDFWILDNIQKYQSGDYNDARDFNEWIKPVLALIREYRVGLLILDHVAKPGKNQEKTSIDYSAGAYQGMGTSRKANMARTTCELYPPMQDGRFRLQFSKSGSWTGLKNSEGKPLDHLFLEQSGIIEEPFWKIAGSQAPPIRGQKSRIDPKELKSCLEEEGMTQALMADRFGVSERTINREVAKLGAKGRGNLILPKMKKK